MERNEVFWDVDDYIFAGQDWYPSEKQGRILVLIQRVHRKIDNCQLILSFLFTERTFSAIIYRNV